MTDDGCAHVLQQGDYYGVHGAPEPPEYCPEPVIPGTDRCAEHYDLSDDDEVWAYDLGDLDDDDDFEEFEGQ